MPVEQRGDKTSFGFWDAIGCSVLIGLQGVIRLCLNPTFQRAADFRQIVDADWSGSWSAQKPAREHFQNGIRDGSRRRPKI